MQLKTLLLSIIFIGTSTVFLNAAVAAADSSSAEAKKVVEAEKIEIAEPNLPSGVYSYKVAWQGIPVAKAKISVERDSVNGKDFYHVTADAKTVRGIDWMYKLRHRSESLFHADTFEPVKFQFRQKENRRKKFREIYFQDDGSVQAKRWKNGKQREDTDFATTGQTFDPVSAAFLARSVPISVGKSVSIDVFNGKDRYLIAFNVIKKEMVKVKGKKRLAFKVVPVVTKLTTSKKDKRLKSATLWLSADKKRDILKMKSEVVVGSVSAELVSFYPQRKTPTDDTGASMKAFLEPHSVKPTA